MVWPFQIANATNPMERRKRAPNRVPSLISASREAALNAIQSYHNPLTKFKSETFIINMTVAWTYLLHAFYIRRRVDIGYFQIMSEARRFDRTQGRGYRYWDLSRCISVSECPLRPEVKSNIEFMIGLRNEVVHKGSTELDDALAPMFLANCINFEKSIVDLFGRKYSLDPHLRFALQFRDLVHSHHLDAEPLPSNVTDYITTFETALPASVLDSPGYAYRVFMTRRTANNPNRADRVIEFVDENSDIARQLNREQVVIKERERSKKLPKTIVDTMKRKGFPSFTVNEHTKLWQAVQAKNPGMGLGVEVEGKWFWYDEWLDVVKRHCKTNSDLYRRPTLSTDDRRKVVFPNSL